VERKEKKEKTKKRLFARKMRKGVPVRIHLRRIIPEYSIVTVRFDDRGYCSVYGGGGGIYYDTITNVTAVL
jgi:hypothetical protein